ncbi:putative cysteine peptidase [Metamycoplasma spumans]|uniref:putative cysteine peptidase n=1 Tax=Metamycoplasma spumans TaxID=92406 RepID=UPI0034DDAB49
MKRKFLNISLGAIALITPVTMVSLRIPYESTEEDIIRIEKQYRDKLSSYCLYDFIKLTGRVDTKIKFVSRNYLNPETNKYLYIVGYEKSGFSVFDQEKEKIIEVIPNWNISDLSSEIMSNDDLVYYRESNVEISIINKNDRDKLMIGDHRRPKKKTDDKNINDDWKNNKDNSRKKVDFSNFNYNDLLELQNAKKSEYSKFGIREELNGFLYADNEIDHSWIFKTKPTDTFGKNDSYKYISKDSDGICGYIVVNQMMLYNEYFINSGYMNMAKSNKYINKEEKYHVDITKPDPEEWSPRHRKSPSIKLKENMERYSAETKKHYLYNNYFSPKINDIYMEDILNKHFYEEGTVYEERKIILDDFVKDNGGTTNYNFAKLKITKNSINEFIKNQKKPIFLKSKTKDFENGKYYNRDGNHIYVAYGSYNDGRVLINYNWLDEHTQVILDIDHIYGAEYLEDTNSNKNLKKYFWNGVEHVTGPEMTNYLKLWGFIK